MTSNSAEPVNILSREARKLPITMLIDFFRATMQQWWCQRRNVGVERKKDVTEYVEKVIDRRINKSFGFRVYQIDQSRYEVSSYFTMETYRSTYAEVVFPMPIPAEYEEPDEVMVVYATIDVQATSQMT
uniref:Uncharacterized protein n=1 Tax=Lactuca sativa TaxID=4236 RepID=A0A9R1W2E2_LACSA|nr:hypothetical protein LSAT_V11C300133330 [Lactuca sativa]